MKLTAALLVGGTSSRMGRDKALLPFGSVTLLDQTLKKLTTCADEVLVVGRSAPEGTSCHPLVRFEADTTVWPSGKSSMAGLHSALTLASHDWIFVLACDMPFFNPSLLELLKRHCNGAQAVVPLLDGSPQPLCALYHKSVARQTHRLLERDELRLRQFLKDRKLKIVFVEVPESFLKDQIFFNVNTPEDYQQAQDLCQRRDCREGEEP